MRKITASILITSLFGLISCGGGSTGPCGSDLEVFSVRFAQASYTIAKGTPASINSNITPESCRGSMQFEISNGTISGEPSSNSSIYLPPGMTLSNGNITGTPTTSGTYTFALYISGVKGYKDFKGGISNPHSAGTTIKVSP